MLNIPQVYNIHAKDFRGADSEVSQMIPDWRPVQFAAESIALAHGRAWEEALDLIRSAAIVWLAHAC